MAAVGSGGAGQTGAHHRKIKKHAVNGGFCCMTLLRNMGQSFFRSRVQRRAVFVTKGFCGFG